MKQGYLQFLVDVGVGRKVETYLTEQGYDVKTVQELNPKMPDHEIVQIAVDEKRMIITMDKDFGELVYHSNLGHSGILLLRLDDATGDEKVRVVQHIMENYAEKIANVFCVYKNDKIRIRKLSKKEHLLKSGKSS